ncbi:MAG TPA: PAS domain S-box protein [Polyangiaceae bacterium]|nr:PAS domain S-box protein [Polyangiaceae bacterium]
MTGKSSTTRDTVPGAPSEHGELNDQAARVRERLALLSSASFEGLVFHVDGVVFDVNQRMLEITGFDREELLGDQLLQRCVDPADLPEVVRRTRNRIEGEYVVTGIRKDGSRYRAELQSKQGKLGDRPVRVVAVRDVSERERTQALLRESEARLAELAAIAFDITVFSRDGVIVDVSGAFERILGYTREQLVGHRIIEFIPIAVAPEAGRVIERSTTGVFESSVQSASGESIPIEVVAIQSTLRGEPIRMSVVRDLRTQRALERERRDLERVFAQTQRLDGLGLLAGGIAHDFNNLLTAILGNADLLRGQLNEPPLQLLAQTIGEAAQRAAGLTAQMLAYAGKSELGPRTPVDLGALVTQLRVLLDATLSKKAKVELALEAGSVVLGNPATLTQLLMNLLTNASDALVDEPGSIGIRLASVTRPDARFARALGVRAGPGHWVLIEVSDTGIGMDEVTRLRVFEPFFTTKQQGHGLGLAACIGIVSSHGGAILVESEPGRGSTFSVLLPAYQGKPAEAVPSAPRERIAERRVLVVDDERLVRSHLRHALRSQGYEVIEAATGTDALAAIEQDVPSAIVLDVTMPDISGIELLRRIRARGVVAPVILSSGYHAAALDVERDSFQAFLAKPYTLSELFETLARVMT